MSSIIALDIGDKRIGVAKADLGAAFATPLTTLLADSDVVTQFLDLLKNHRVKAVVVGLPRNQSGQKTDQTRRVKHIASLLNIPKSVALFWQDESLTSVKAEAELQKRGRPFQKEDVDALAATYILEDFIGSSDFKVFKNHLFTHHSKIATKTRTTKPAVHTDPVNSQNQDAGRSKSHKLWWISSAILVVFMLIAGALIWYNNQLSPLTNDNIYHVVTINPGATTKQIANQLEKSRLIKSSDAFELYIKLNHIDGLQAGAYRLSSNQSVRSIAETIASGKVTSVNVLIAPGLTIEQIEAVLEKDGYSEGDINQALQSIRTNQFLADSPPDASLEGYLFPDTYKIGPDTTANQLLNLIVENFEQHITQQITAGLAAQGLTLNQGIILASIVQKEVSDANVQPTVAQVFLKRLKAGETLGSDVTAIYGAEQAGKNVNVNDPNSVANAVNFDSPYNTRIHSGLPPGAISNFNISALEAVANPSPTDYSYFVAGDDGTVHFSDTFAQHQSMIEQYCKKSC